MREVINSPAQSVLTSKFSGHETSPFFQALADSPIAFLTRHHKERLLEPVFRESLGLNLIHTDIIDTDSLGSFSREIPRHCTQHEAARKKAKLGAQHLGTRFGIGSEGAFVSDPWFGVMPWNMEIVLLLDTQTGVEVAGFAEAPGMCLQREITDWASLEKFAEQAGFPNHHLMIRPDSPHSQVSKKGIRNLEELRQAFDQAIIQSHNQQVFVENDLRAHCNPTRQTIIVNAAKNLIERLQSVCPACSMPDFWKSQEATEKPCRDCGKPARTSNSNVWSCKHCGYCETLNLDSDLWLDPAYCNHCNP